MIYVSEPFHLPRPGKRYNPTGTRFRHWYTYICADNESEHRASVRRAVKLGLHLPSLLSCCTSARGAYGVSRRLAKSLKRRLGFGVPLVKDPYALFSSEWLAATFDMRVVVLIRHPAAFVGSLKRMDWQPDSSHFLEQPLLIRDLLGPLEDAMKLHQEERRPFVDRAILLWRVSATGSPSTGRGTQIGSS